MEENQYRFQVNLGGMIEILSDHLYSSPDVFIRELLQNGVDAITGREMTDSKYKDNKEGTITISLEEGKSIVFTDNGVGLTESEIHRFLSIIGESSKRDIETGRILNEYIGRFGIGLLSCFMVTDSITVKTRSSADGSKHIWVGNPDGTYTINELEEDIPVGTQMHLKCKEGLEQYYSADKIRKLVNYYGLILPYPVILICGGETERLNPEVLPWEKPVTNFAEILQFGHELFGTEFLDFVLIHSEAGSISGVAYILPYPVSATTKQKHRIYLKNMLLTEEPGELIPDWAVFTKCIINARDLRPTASRESLYEDDNLKEARENISKCLIEYVKALSKTDNPTFRTFMYLHQLAVKAIACEDDDLYMDFIDYFTFHTTAGEITGKMIKDEGQALYCSHEKYMQLAQIFTAQQKLLVDVGYIYDYTLLISMADFFDVAVMPVVGDEIDDILCDITPNEDEQCRALIKAAKDTLADYECRVSVKRFEPAEVPCFYSLNEAKQILNQIIDLENDEGVALFDDMLSEFHEEFEEEAASTLYLNYDNPVIRRLIRLMSGSPSPEEVKRARRIICVLYVQTLLIGNFPLRNNELALLNENLLGLAGDIL